MSRNPEDGAQDAPTAPQPRDANGYALDGEGLPINGPARARALAEREATAKKAQPAPAPKQTEKDVNNG